MLGAYAVPPYPPICAESYYWLYFTICI